MPSSIYGIPMEYASICIVGAVGVILKMMISSIYRRDIKNTRDIESTSKKKKWIKNILENYHELFTNDKTRNTSLFTSERLEQRNFAGIRLKKWDMIINQTPFLIVTMICGFTYYEIYFGKTYLEILLYEIFGITAVMTLVTLCRFMNNKEKKETIHIQLTNHLENKLLPKILETKFGEERLLTSNEGYPLAAAPKPSYTTYEKETISIRDKDPATKYLHSSHQNDSEIVHVDKILTHVQRTEAGITDTKMAAAALSRGINVTHGKRTGAGSEKSFLDESEQSAATTEQEGAYYELKQGINNKAVADVYEKQELNNKAVTDVYEKEELNNKAVTDVYEKQGLNNKAVTDVYEKEELNNKAVADVYENQDSTDTLRRSMNQTLVEAYPEKKITEEEKRIIEEVLKEYLFK